MLKQHRYLGIPKPGPQMTGHARQFEPLGMALLPCLLAGQISAARAFACFCRGSYNSQNLEFWTLQTASALNNNSCRDIWPVTAPLPPPPAPAPLPTPAPSVVPAVPATGGSSTQNSQSSGSSSSTGVGGFHLQCSVVHQVSNSVLFASTMRCSAP